MTLLRTQGLSRRFGGIHAVENVDFALGEGEIRAIIGPNGAGKTTFVGLICGRIAPSAGRIEFAGANITPLGPWDRVAAGIAYTFQITSIFRNLSCFENVALGVQRSRSHRGGRWWPKRQEIADGVAAALTTVGLAGRAEQPAGSLAYGHQRLLEIAIGLALAPRLLILDEPTQGLSDGEIENFCALMRQLSADTTVLLIEHNMPVVMALADRITVMDSGRILAEGTADEVCNDRRVQEAYLGT